MACMRSFSTNSERGDVKSFRNFVRMDPEMFNQMVEDLTPKLQKKTTNWVPRGPEHHRQCCARGVPNHLRPLPRDSLQVSHNRRAVEGGGPGLVRQVELPSLLWLHRWEASADAGSTSLWQSVLKLQRLLLHHHAGSSGCQLQFFICGCGAYGADSDAGIFRECGLHHALEQDKAGLPPSESLPCSDTEVPYFLVDDDACYSNVHPLG